MPPRITGTSGPGRVSIYPLPASPLPSPTGLGSYTDTHAGEAVKPGILFQEEKPKEAH